MGRRRRGFCGDVHSAGIHLMSLTPALVGPIQAQRGFDIVNAYSVAFFDQHIKGRPAALLKGPSTRYPEVIFSASGADQNPLPFIVLRLHDIHVDCARKLMGRLVP